MLVNKTTLKACLIVEDKGKVLLLEQTENNGGNFTFIGGKVEKEESATQTLIREGFEEAGIILTEKDLDLVHTLHLHKGRKSHLFLYFKAKKWKGDIDSYEPKKFTQAAWYAYDDLPTQFSEVHRIVFQQYLKGQSFTHLRMITSLESSIQDEITEYLVQNTEGVS